MPGHPDEPQADVEQNENENRTHNEDTTAEQHESTEIAVTSAEKPTSSAVDGSELPIETYQLPHANTFPCTPGTRLPLEDLIGNFDETLKKPEAPEQSPEEHIGWIPNSSSTLLTPNRKRKRARSSSPSCPNTSSQRQEASIFFSGKVAEADKTTPEADPATDLWRQNGAGKPVDGDAKVSAFNHLMFQVSPRALETPGKNVGLRRWASTGNDWPSSKSKRRRTNGRPSINLWQDEQAGDSCGKSKVAAMVDRLQESLASQKLVNPRQQPDVRVEGPSSSSPLPETGAAGSFSGVPAASPLQSKHQNAVRPDNLEPRKDISKSMSNPIPPQVATSDGHYGSDSRGNDTKPSLPVESVISAPLHLQSKAPLPAYKRPSINRTQSNNAQARQAAPAPAPVRLMVSEDFDEFGDDLDLSAEDLEELMTQPLPLHRRPLHQIPAHPDPPPQQQMDMDLQQAQPRANMSAARAPQPTRVEEFDDNEDEFGCDDIDEDSFAQAEINATQAFRASHSNSGVTKC